MQVEPSGDSLATGTLRGEKFYLYLTEVKGLDKSSRWLSTCVPKELMSPNRETKSLRGFSSVLL